MKSPQRQVFQAFTISAVLLKKKYTALPANTEKRNKNTLQYNGDKNGKAIQITF